jgi:peptide/nickel transport system substrate-binding protein
MQNSRFYPVSITMALLALTVLLFSTLITPISADTPAVLEIEVSTGADTTKLTITVRHNNPTSSHYVNKIDVEVDDDVQQITISEAQTSTQFTITHDIGQSEYQRVRVRANCNIHGWSSWKILGEQPQSGCLVATATYGSELSPQVQFLRGFRDHTVLNTFTGRSFMTAFNHVYYSFSPNVASVITENEPLRDIMKVVLYPLIGVLHVSSIAFSLFNFNPELGVVAAGLVASVLIGLVYITPLVFVVCLLKKFIPSPKLQRWASFMWVGSVFLMIIGVVAGWSILMMISTSIFVLATMSLPVLVIINLVRRYIH